MSKPCQNQGFVLDGYPKTIKQAKALFDKTDEEEEEVVQDEEEEEDGDRSSYNKNIMPGKSISSIFFVVNYNKN